jgi:hypothetical protein
MYVLQNTLKNGLEKTWQEVLFSLLNTDIKKRTGPNLILVALQKIETQGD